MKKKKIIQLAITINLMVFFTLCFSQGDTLRIATYNFLNFPDSSHVERTPYFRIVVNAINPDILVVQDITSQEGINYLLLNVLNYYQPNEYSATPFVDGPYSDNILFYKINKLSLISNRQISTGFRDISEYILSCYSIENSPTFRVFSAHLERGSAYEDQQKRLAQTTIIREELDNFPENTLFFLCGTLNFYSDSEPGFEMLATNNIYNNGKCSDPINRLGDWHYNPEFSDVHTTSTRTAKIGGGFGDGLKNRFDLIMISDAILNGISLSYVNDSFTMFGNDGQHYGLRINDNNSILPDSIADALYYASDHLPVYMDFVVSAASTPVELTNYKAFVKDDEVQLFWETVSESNNYGFVVERKSCPNNWNEIGFVQGYGTTTELNNYFFCDKDVKPGEYFYRLKQIDFDGKFEYSNSINVSVQAPTHYFLEQNYPNPFNASTIIKFDLPEKALITLTVLDMLGKEISIITKKEYEAGGHEIIIDASELSSGLYFYKFRTMNFLDIKKFIVLK